jgi:hypothetical protein
MIFFSFDIEGEEIGVSVCHGVNDVLPYYLKRH